MPDVTPPVFGSDEPYWYRNGRWGDAGYAVPNCGGKLYTLNTPIAQLFHLVGRNLFEILHQPDRRFSRPPGIGCLWAIHQLIVRARQIMSARSVPFNQPRFDPEHATPSRQVFMVFPVPYFGDAIRQQSLREWTTLVLLCLGEMAQHTDNELAFEVTDAFTSTVGKYLKRIYFLMATGFFGKAKADAMKDDFLLTDADFKAYDPSKWFTPVELTDERPDMGWIPTENDLRGIRGLPADQLVGLMAYPTGQIVPVGGVPNPMNPQTTSPAVSTGAFTPPPGPPTA